MVVMSSGALIFRRFDSNAIFNLDQPDDSGQNVEITVLREISQKFYHIFFNDIVLSSTSEHIQNPDDKAPTNCPMVNFQDWVLKIDGKSITDVCN